MERESRWFHSVWSVLLALFVFLGPLGLPLLWKSPRFSRPMKVVLTVLTAVYTLVLIGGTIEAVRIAREVLGIELTALPQLSRTPGWTPTR